ncbi:MAG TPA: hypothetical protein VKY19_21960 [Ktedonosporobacter sp.]|nr:hypothetical protein [Ktedonosporobacter sp.]
MSSPQQEQGMVQATRGIVGGGTGQPRGIAPTHPLSSTGEHTTMGTGQPEGRIVPCGCPAATFLSS